MTRISSGERNGKPQTESDMNDMIDSNLHSKG